MLWLETGKSDSKLEWMTTLQSQYEGRQAMIDGHVTIWFVQSHLVPNTFRAASLSLLPDLADLIRSLFGVNRYQSRHTEYNTVFQSINIKIRTVYLGSSKKIEREEALRKARKLKADVSAFQP